MSIKVDTIERELRKMDKNLKGDDLDLGVIMLSAANVGTSEKALTKFTGYNPSRVKGHVAALKKNGIFKGGKVHDSGWFEKDGGIAFFCDMAVAKGWLKRTNEKKK